MKSTNTWMVPIVLTALLGVVGLAPAYAGGIYKWRDEHGKVHYGDKPRSTAEEISIKQQPAGTTHVPTESERKDRRQRLLNMFQEERERARIEAEKEKNLRAKAAQNCALARDRFRSLERSAYVYNLDKQGNRVVLSDQHREEAIRTARQDIDRWCKQTAHR